MRFLRPVLISIGFLAVCIGGWYLAYSPITRLSSVEVILDPSSRESFLFEKIQSSLTASLGHYLGLPFWRISLDDVMTEVRRDRRVRTARISRDFPHHMRVIVVPQEPLLAFMDDRGRIFPIARDATLMPSITLKDAPNFPLLRGAEFQTDEYLRERAVLLIEAVPTEGRFSRSMISEILHTNKDGFELYLTNQVAEIKMGEDEFELKANRVEKVLSYLHNRGLKGRTIDARFAKKVVVRVRSDRRSHR